MLKKSILGIGCLFFLVMSVWGQSRKQLEKWQEGYMDIHQIATGKGNSCFAILPDGTTLLIDAGDLSDLNAHQQELMPALPDSSRLPGEWITRYVKAFSAPLNNKNIIDVAFITHFHDDHIGDISKRAVRLADRGYSLSGIAQVGEYLDIRKIVDRGWPDYDFPSRESINKNTRDFNNYLHFVNYQHTVRKTPVEKFSVGSVSQFKLLHSPEMYPDFSIRNIYSNGTIWTGVGEDNVSLLTSEELAELSENNCSNVIKISYGKFDYYTGGDISADKIETAVGRLVGPVEVAVTNHHAYSDACHESFVSSLRPQAFIIPVWDFYHPQPETLGRLLAPMLYPEDRLIFATGLVEGNKVRLGDLGNKIKPYGHVVLRVYPGGNKFQLFVLDAHDEEYAIIYESDLLKAE